VQLPSSAVQAATVQKFFSTDHYHEQTLYTFSVCFATWFSHFAPTFRRSWPL